MKIIRHDSFGEDDEMEPESMEKAPVMIPRIRRYCGRFVRPLIQLYSVYIMNFTGNIYGTIRVQDTMLLQDLYIREREESEPICPAHNELLMSGPDVAMSARGDFAIFVDLMELHAWVHCVHRDAVEAAVEVKLIIRDGEDPSHVFGRITACNSYFAEEILLFRKRSDKHMDVRSGQLIPLSRFVVTVPVHSFLIVRADLWNYNAISSDAIVKGTVEFPFPTELRGTFEKRICGQCSEIQVKGTFGQLKDKQRPTKVGRSGRGSGRLSKWSRGFMEMMKTVKCFQEDEEDDEEEFGLKKDGYFQKVMAPRRSKAPRRPRFPARGMKFEESLNVEQVNGRKYRNFIRKMRNNLRFTYSHNIGVLPKLQKPIRFFDVIIETNKSNTRLRFQLNDLYLLGFQNRVGRWFEFPTEQGADEILQNDQSPPEHEMTDSELLPFDGNYNDLIGENMETTKFGRARIVTAAHVLNNSTNNSARKSACFVLIQIISESIRFRLICDHLSHAFEGDQIKLSPQMTALERNWGVLSNLLLKQDQNHDEPFSLAQPHASGIKSFWDVTQALGLLLRQIFPVGSLAVDLDAWFNLKDADDIYALREKKRREVAKGLLLPPAMIEFHGLFQNIENLRSSVRSCRGHQKFCSGKALENFVSMKPFAESDPQAFIQYSSLRVTKGLNCYSNVECDD
ncbi:hypothetical protein HHK36_019021 [Tetracentron sinense]|uniref:rRNA N-glycosylase n=1 Tax=Tetracentron sinense TaxID=13715 RepID=A0A834YYK7_TETSI|nr:hypothetical protein HHK36_019021 [Tetracentron sinense]